MNPNVIQTDRLTRWFGGKCAVDQVSFCVPRGSVFALLGRNGSGKTSLVRMLLGMLDPTRGGGTILGDDIRNIRPVTRGKIGYIAEGHPLIDWMRVKDLEAFQRSFFTNWTRHSAAASVRPLGKVRSAISWSGHADLSGCRLSNRHSSSPCRAGLFGVTWRSVGCRRLAFKSGPQPAHGSQA